MSDTGNDTYVEVTHQSWFGRLGESVKGIVIGLILIPCAFVLLSWNEERSADRSSALATAAAVVVTAQAERVDSANDGALVHVMGRAVTDDVVRDSDFGVDVNALKLVRSVEMFQWRESTTQEVKEKLGGGTETVTTTSYTREWASDLADSSAFRQPRGHENPRVMPFFDTTHLAGRVTLGAFRLPDDMVDSLDEERPVPLAQSVPAPPAEIAGRPVRIGGNEFYLGNNPDHPAVGDLRIAFTMVPPVDVSLVARQHRDTFMPYATPTGDVQLIETGLKGPEALFRTAESENALLTWALRIVGFCLMFFGFKLTFAVIEVAASFIPPLGWLTGGILSMVAGVLALVLSLGTIGTAWLAQRPLAAAGIGAVVLAVVAGIWLLRRRAATASPRPSS
ncbi:TMEM43 family protein [Novispirillum sp. DQ9]|uniref:TMEM43 family protein n=1 Tax=Novispirillum sp. DQ9 TaxID=3398612 RepID=UPI003C7D6EB0